LITHHELIGKVPYWFHEWGKKDLSKILCEVNIGITIHCRVGVEDFYNLFASGDSIFLVIETQYTVSHL